MKSFPASLDHLYHMIDYVKKESFANGFTETQFRAMEIAIEEALVNVIHHGYKNQPVGQIFIQCVSDPFQFNIIIEDNGLAHNPLSSKRTIDKHEPMDTREPGGYGVHFMTEIMDKVLYERKGEKNRLTLIKSRKTNV